jgi:hypothetical protein
MHEIDDLYGLPRFTDEDRLAYFDLSEAERRMIDSRTTSVAMHLTLQLGYFKAKHQFFQYNHDTVHDDLFHILGRYFPGTDLADVNMPSRPTQYALQQSILELLGFRSCDNALRAELERRAQRTTMLSTQPIYILRESLQYLNQQHLVAPAYTFSAGHGRQGGYRRA